MLGLFYRLDLYVYCTNIYKTFTAKKNVLMSDLLFPYGSFVVTKLPVCAHTVERLQLLDEKTKQCIGAFEQLNLCGKVPNREITCK